MHMVRLFILIKNYNFTPHHVLHTVHASCHAISLDDGRTCQAVAEICAKIWMQFRHLTVIWSVSSGPQEMEDERRVEDRS